MELQDNGRFAVRSSVRKRSWSERCLFPRNLARLLFTVAFAWFSAAHAQSSSYVYDANGRIVAVNGANGTSAQYNYDAIGNLISVSSLPAGQLAIFAFTPADGVLGTQVTIRGQGFSPSSQDNAVTFNGAPAAVVSASGAQLTVTVPEGATTGPISVTVNGVTATSATSFIVDESGLPPTISAVSSSVVAVSDNLSVTGLHLSPLSGQTVVLLGGRDVSAGTSISDGQIQHVITSSDTSGFVTIETPFGRAVSTNPVLVVPAGVSAASITSTAYAVSGGSANLSITAGGQTGALLFQGDAGAWISLQLSAINTQASHVNYSIYAPGNQLILQGSVSSGSPSIHLPRLLVGGTYLATFTPDNAGAQLTVGPEDADTLTVDTPTTVTTTIPGESKRLLFQGAVDQVFALLLDNRLTNPAGQAIGFTIYSPGQQSYTSGSSSINSTVNLPSLPNAGVYQLITGPASGVTSTQQIELVSSAPAVLTPNGQSHNYSGYAVGQNATLTFTANEGDNLELTFSNMVVTGSTSSPVMVNVYDSNGTNISSRDNCYLGWTCGFPLWNLASGQYTVVLSPPDSGSAIGFDVMLQPDTVAPPLSVNTTATVNLGLGQVERLTFDANAGDNMSLVVSNVSTSNPSGLPVYVSIYRPDSSPITIGNYYSTNSMMGFGNINLFDLPVTGTYTVVVSAHGLAGSAGLTLSPIEMQSIVANGVNQSYTAGGAGKIAFLTFDANQGDNLEFTLNGVSITGSNASPVTLNVYDPSGTNIVSKNNCYLQWTCGYSLWNLSAGKYTVVISPPDSSSAISFNAKLEPDMQGPALSIGTQAAVNLGLGQVERLTFNASVGDNLTLNLSNVSTSNPSGLSVYVSVYRPDVNAITPDNYYATFSAKTSNALTLQGLPVAGTYTVVVTTHGVAGSAQLSLSPVATQSIAANGANQSYTADGSGKSVFLTFDANQGDDLEFTLNGVSITGSSGSPVTLNVYDPSGANIVSKSNCYLQWTCGYSLWNLSAGKYTVVVSPPDSGSAISFYAKLEPDMQGPILSVGAQTTVNLELGQVERLTFSASVGESVTLSLLNVSTSNPSGLSVYASVYRPDVNEINPDNYYGTFNAKSSNDLSLQNLPVSGIYTIVVTAHGVAGSAIVKLSSP